MHEGKHIQLLIKNNLFDSCNTNPSYYSLCKILGEKKEEEERTQCIIEGVVQSCRIQFQFPIYQASRTINTN